MTHAIRVGNYGAFQVPEDGPLYRILESKSLVEQLFTTPVLDTCRGFFDMTGSRARFELLDPNHEGQHFERNDISLSGTEDFKSLCETLRVSRTIVLILESPHDREFRGATPLVPANGSSGTQIIQFRSKENEFSDLRHIEYIVKCLRDNLPRKESRYPLIICNPIQYQTSLFSILGPPLNKRVRDHVWSLVWELEEIRRDFLKRLKNYRPALIINACTNSDKEGTPLSEQVWNVIRSQYGSPHVSTYCSSNHPCSWNTSQKAKKGGNPYGLASFSRYTPRGGWTQLQMV